MSMLRIFQLLLQITSSFSRYLEKRQLLEVGRAMEQRDQLTRMWNHVEEIRKMQRSLDDATRRRLRERFKDD
jgi:response regulator of citrate/malate metabolism